jgi:4'-phosphopantetheinyl transferase
LCLIKPSSEDSPIPIDAGLPDPASAVDASRLELHANDVHIWLAKLDDFAADSLQPLLTEDELARAARFHFAKDRNHFMVARGWLRRLLGAYLDINARDLRFSYAEKGKPALEVEQPDLLNRRSLDRGSLDRDSLDQGSLNFNLAHSNALAIYAFSRDREVGVDLEFMRDDLADEKIAERFFSPGENEVLKGLPAELRKQAFFDCWTRKEAYIKARGEGLSMPLAEFDVSLAPGDAAALLSNHKEPEEVARWSMQSVVAPAGYVAAVVAAGHGWQVKMFTVDRFVG